MRIKLIIALMLFTAPVFSQQSTTSPLDPLSFGVVLDDPEVKNVLVKKDIVYLKDAKGSLALDVYLPPNIKVS